MAEDTITLEEFLRFKKAVIKHLKRLEGLNSDAFQAISDLDDRLTPIVDEAVDRSNRAQRAVRRLEKRVDELDEED